MVASCDVKFPIRLEGLAFAHGFFCSVSGCELVHMYKAKLGLSTSHKRHVHASIREIFI